ncbi:DUF3006 domain-containing protein [Marinisporobacter balticus]|uniref:DUF3006 family protein n=1 Tax=Marinisporobacter balticus TaxID=2018667 RepID=A0A4R2L158_9FIRM|nr:DUF3006 domain-containing protein [Marinisporobacter balticus]TCO77446.1 DUF3006 family protein [Marinisporobacter balticus]
MYAVIDRFEGSFAICQKDDGEMINIEKSRIPFYAKEGDVLSLSKDKVIIDQDETGRRKTKIEGITKDLWE